MDTVQLSAAKIKYIKWFVVAQLLDLFSTFIGIGLLGFREANPIMKHATFFEMTLVKILAITIIVCTLYYVKQFPLWFYKVIFTISVIPPILNIVQIIIVLIFFLRL